MRTYQRGAFVVLAILLLCTSSFSMYEGKQNASDTETEVRGLIVKFGPQVRVNVQRNAAGSISTGLPEMDRLNSRWGVTRVDRIVKAADVRPGHPFAQYYVIEAAGSPDYERMKSEYAQLGSVEMAELDHVFEFDAEPNDPLFQYQFNLYNTGQTHPVVVRVDGDYNDYVAWVSGLEGADINAYDVLASPPDNTSTVVVAIIDSGVDLDHPDLVGRIWTNVREVADNGLDDDRNGYIDDVVGWDFNGDESDNDPTDELGHGSHCAGIAAGAINNSVGITGVCPDVKVMAVRTGLVTSDLVGGIVYAVDNGADVISMSWGGFYYPISLSDALVYAKSKGAVLCAAAGNMGQRAITYPAFALQTISVGASTDQDEVVYFSTYNYRVDLVAPGVDILSLRADDLDLYATGGSSGIEPGVHIIDDYYYLMSGTSMSCPTVAGVAACLKAVSPGISPDKTKEILTQTADDYVDPYGTGAHMPGWDEYSGWGRVNLGEAISATPSVIAEIISPFPNQNLAGPSVSITGTAGGDDFVSYVLEYGEGWNPTEWTPIAGSTSPVTGGLLGTWSVESLVGHYTIRLQVGDDNYDMVTAFVGSELTAEMTSPVDGDTLSGFTRINGTVYGAAVTRWVLDYRPSGGGMDWTELVNNAEPYVDDLIHLWQTVDLEVGSYDLRLSVYSTAGLEFLQEVTVHKIPTADPDWTADLGAPYTTLGPNYGDFDGDGQKEFIIGTNTGIRVINADGTEKTTGLPTFPYGDFRQPISVGNLDGDGIDDIVAVRFDAPGVYGFPSSGDDFVIPFSGSYVYTPLAVREYQWVYVILDDTDGDGIDEMYLHCGSSSADYIIPLEVGDVAVGEVWSGLTEFVAADLNNDGINERYGFRYTENSVQQLDETGSVIDEYIPLDIPDGKFWSTGLSAYDIDGDNKLELILSGYYIPAGGTYVLDFASDVMVYAFDEGLERVDGWPHHTGLYYYYTFHPVFGDINGDGLVEYFITSDDIAAGHVRGWHVDGTPYSFDTEDPPVIDSACLTPPMLADINGDGYTEIVAGYYVVNNYGAGYINGIAAWDTSGHMLPGFPLAYDGGLGSCGRIMPLIGDIDDDGKVDMAVPMFQNQLAFFEFDADFDTAASPAVSWHYNQSLNPVGPSFWSQTVVTYQCGDADGDGEVVPLDAVYIVSWFWGGGPPPVSIPAIDVDGSGGVDPLDAIYFVNWMWRGGPGVQCP